MNFSKNYNAIDIASFFIRKGVSPLKLQKLLYYSQVWFFVTERRMLFQDTIRAWKFGPVVHQVWSEFKYMKRSSVIPQDRAKNVNLKNVQGFLEEVWDAYGHLSSSNLVDLTHKEKPWQIARKGTKDGDPSKSLVVINVLTTSSYKLDGCGRIPRIKRFQELGRYSS